MKILIVDDDVAILKLCAVTLRAEGHAVVACERGGQALQAALREEFDLAICDLNLPDIHGLEVVRAIKMQAPALAVIVMSALDPDEWMPLARQAGADHFLSKPVHLDDLRDEVAMVEQGRTGLDVVVAMQDHHERRAVLEQFRSAGARVRVADDVASMLVFLAEHSPHLFIVDADLRDSHVLVMVSGRRRIPCFVVAGAGFDEEVAMRDGASFVMIRPLNAEQLLLQGRFLVSGR